MISVDRSAVPTPKALDGPTSKAATELAKARAHFSKPNPGSFKGFKAYKDPTVKEALETLFHGKCAYCESIYAANQPVDIEHYRPKSGFVDAQGQLVKPGYWWLAADWDNLLPSCIDCNRARGHTTIDDEEETLGKANQFPIADEAKRWRAENDPDEEARLLLDPCRDQPERLLSFGVKGEVQARATTTADEQRIVRESIRVYGLNRSGLGTVRREAVIAAQGKLSAITRAAEAIKARAQAGEAPSVALRTELADVVRQVLRMRRVTSPFTALARQRLSDAMVRQLRTFVEHHFGADLQAADGSAPAADDVLDRFVERCATQQSFAESEAGTLAALRSSVARSSAPRLDLHAPLIALKRAVDDVAEDVDQGRAISEAHRAELAGAVRQIVGLRAVDPAARQRLDAVTTRLGRFVARHFADALKDPDGKKPAADRILDPFVERFASSRDFADVEADVLAALGTDKP